MQLRKFTALLLLSSTLAFGMAGAEESAVAPGTSDTPAEDHAQNRDQMQKRRADLTEEEKQAMRERWESLSDEEKQAIRERRAKMRERWKSMTDEERQEARDKMKSRQGGKGQRHDRPGGPEGHRESGGPET